MADPIIAYGFLATIIIAILGAIFYLQSQHKKGEELHRQEQEEQEAQARRNQGGNRAAANRNARARLRATLAARRGEDLPLEDEPQAAAPLLEDSDGEDDDEEEVAVKTGKIGKKKAAKLQMKAEKKALREQQEREREEKKKRDAERADEEKKKEEEEAKLEAQRLEEERKIQEEKERREQEEYEKMKVMFSVEDSGFDQNADDDSERNFLQEFVDYIKDEKVVVLEELAARFRLKTQAVIDRVTALQSEGTLTGVLDDRGKFIYISMKEMEDIAKFIRQRGRVTLAELSEASGTLVSLTPESQQSVDPCGA